MTAKSCTIYDDARSEYRTFHQGDVFDDNDPVDEELLKKLGDHLFAPQESKPVDPLVELHTLKVPELIELCRDRGLEPASGKKQDLIRALEEDMRGLEELAGE